MGLFRLFGVLSPAHIGWLTRFGGAKFAGADAFGNRYYSGAPRKGYNRDRRWVIFKDDPEASSVPPEWHGWLHHQTDEIPAETGSFRQKWQKPHRPNLTGTNGAYRPPGHVLAGGRRDKATGDYEPWMPSE